MSLPWAKIQVYGYFTSNHDKKWVLRAGGPYDKDPGEGIAQVFGGHSGVIRRPGSPSKILNPSMRFRQRSCTIPSRAP